MKHKTSQTLYSYWNDIRRDRVAPLRLEIQPAHISEMLPDTFILERADAQSFRFRLAGTRICSHFGMEMRGLNFLDIWGDSDRDMLEHHFAATSEFGQVVTMLVEATFSTGEQREVEIVVLPLVHTGKSIDRLLCSMSMLKEIRLGPDDRIASVKLLAVESVWPDGRPYAATKEMDRQSPLQPDIRNARIVRQDRRQFRVYQGGLADDAEREW
jgi:hypothetical protein